MFGWDLKINRVKPREHTIFLCWLVFCLSQTDCLWWIIWIVELNMNTQYIKIPFAIAQRSTFFSVYFSHVPRTHISCTLKFQDFYFYRCPFATQLTHLSMDLLWMEWNACNSRIWYKPNGNTCAMCASKHCWMIESKNKFHIGIVRWWYFTGGRF